MFPENDQIDLAAEEGHLMSLVVRCYLFWKSDLRLKRKTA